MLSAPEFTASKVVWWENSQSVPHRLGHFARASNITGRILEKEVCLGCMAVARLTKVWPRSPTSCVFSTRCCGAFFFFAHCHIWNTFGIARRHEPRRAFVAQRTHFSNETTTSLCTCNCRTKTTCAQTIFWMTMKIINKNKQCSIIPVKGPPLFLINSHNSQAASVCSPWTSVWHFIFPQFTKRRALQ